MRNRMSGGVRGRRQKPSPTRSILTEQMRLYVQKFDGEFLATKYFSKSDKKEHIVNNP